MKVKHHFVYEIQGVETKRNTSKKLGVTAILRKKWGKYLKNCNIKNEKIKYNYNTRMIVDFKEILVKR